MAEPGKAPTPEGAEGEAKADTFFHELGHTADAVASGGAGGAAAEEGGPEVITPNLVQGDVMELESMCMSCRENGMTRLLPTRIPFFKDVIIAAFECEHCGNRNSTVQLAEVAEFGTRHTLRVEGREDTNRQVVRASTSTVQIPELGFEMPPNRDQTSVFTTVEGLLLDVVEDLRTNQHLRDAETAAKLDAFMQRMSAMAIGAESFTLVVDDPGGNSFIENPDAPADDPKLECVRYRRTEEQNHELGLYGGNADEGGGVAEIERRIQSQAGSTAGTAKDPAKGGASGTTASGDGGEPKIHNAYRPLTGAGNISGVEAAKSFKGKEGSRFARADAEATERTAAGGAGGGATGLQNRLFFESSASGTAKEVMSIPSDCYNCSKEGEVRSCVTDIPFFKEMLIMSFVCDHCGYRNVEVKGGGEVTPRGRVLELHCTPGEHMSVDLGRDVIKSDTAGVEIPEIQFIVGRGSMGGIYTTVEGLISGARDQVVRANPFAFDGDSAVPERQKKMADFVARVDKILAGEMPFTLRIIDPMANSWIHSPYAPDPDPRLTARDYDRSEAEDRDLGLLDMRTEQSADGTYVASYQTKSGTGEGFDEEYASDSDDKDAAAGESAAEKTPDGDAGDAESAGILSKVSVPLVLGGVVVAGAILAIALLRRK